MNIYSGKITLDICEFHAESQEQAEQILAEFLERLGEACDEHMPHERWNSSDWQAFYERKAEELP